MWGKIAKDRSRERHRQQFRQQIIKENIDSLQKRSKKDFSRVLPELLLKHIILPFLKIEDYRNIRKLNFTLYKISPQFRRKYTDNKCSYRSERGITIYNDIMTCGCRECKDSLIQRRRNQFIRKAE